MGRYIAKELKKDISELPYNLLLPINYAKNSVRQHSLLQQTEITEEVLHGQQTVWGRKLLYVCRRALQRRVSTIFQKKAQSLP